jgi:hypothetical protein
MAEEQKINVPLDAPLELETDDMLSMVPAFHFNDQVKAAGIMANSFKYEGRGFIAGHNRYEFIDQLMGEAATNWPDGWIDRLGDVWAIRDALGVVATFTSYDLQTAEAGAIVSWTRDGDPQYELTGRTSKGQTFTLLIDAYTQRIISGIPSGYSASVTVTDARSLRVQIRRNSDPADRFRYRPALIVSSSYEQQLRLQQITGTGRNLTFKTLVGDLVVAADTISSVPAPLTLVSQSYTIPHITAQVKDSTETEVHIRAGVKQLPYKIANVGFLDQALHEETIVFDVVIEAPILDTHISIRGSGETPPDVVSVFDRTYKLKTKKEVGTIRLGTRPGNVLNADALSVSWTEPDYPTGFDLDSIWTFDSFTTTSVYVDPAATGYMFIDGTAQMNGTTTPGKGTFRLPISFTVRDSVSRISNVSFTGYGYQGFSYAPSTGIITFPNGNTEPIRLNTDYIIDYTRPWNASTTATAVGVPTPDPLDPPILTVTFSGNLAHLCSYDPATNTITWWDGLTQTPSLTVGTLTYPHNVNGSVTIKGTCLLPTTNSSVVTALDTGTSSFTGNTLASQSNAKGAPSGLNTANASISFSWTANLKYYLGTLFRAVVTDIINQKAYIEDITPNDWWGWRPDMYQWTFGGVSIDLGSRSFDLALTEFCVLFDDPEASYTSFLQYKKVDYLYAFQSVDPEPALIQRPFDTWLVASEVSKILNKQQQMKVTIQRQGTPDSITIITDIVNQPMGFQHTMTSTTGFDAVLVGTPTNPDVTGSPIEWVFTIRDDTIREIVVQNHDLSATTGALAPMTLGAMTFATGRQTIQLSTAQGPAVLEGSGTSYTFRHPDWYTEYTIPDVNNFTIYQLNMLDEFIGMLGFRGMINKRYPDMVYIGGDHSTLRYEFTYEGETYFIQADPNAYIKFLIRVQDIVKDRGHIDLEVRDREESFLISESIMHAREPEEGTLIENDKVSTSHQYFALDEKHSLEITGLLVRLIEHDTDRDESRVIEWKYFADLFRFSDFQNNSTRYVTRVGVTSAPKGDTPRLYCLVTDTTEELENVFWLYHTAIRTTDLDYGDLGSWSVYVKKFINGKDNKPSTVDLVYYCDRLLARQVIGSAVLSATVYNNVFYFGIKYQRGIHQWTLKDGNVITGFGSVGIFGLITGNWLPARCCTSNGFSEQPSFELPDIRGDKIYACQGQLVFYYQNVEGFVYAINADGSLLTQPLSNNLYAGVEDSSRREPWYFWEKGEEVEIHHYLQGAGVPGLATLPLGSMIKGGLEALINMPAQLLYEMICSKFPRMIKPKKPEEIVLPQAIVDIFDFDILPQVVQMYGVWGYLGYWHHAGQWLTGPRTGQLVWAPYKQLRETVDLIPNPFMDMILAQIGALEVTKKKNTDPKLLDAGSPGSPGDAGFTQAQSDQLQQMLGGGKGGRFTDDDVAAAARSVGVTDPATIKALQSATDNPPDGAGGKNAGSWRDRVNDVVGMGQKDAVAAVPPTYAEPESITGVTVRSESNASAVAAGTSVEMSKTRNVVSMLANMMDKLDADKKMSMTFTAELHVTDDILHTCYDGQYVYSGPGYFSIQLSRVNRQLMTYQGGQTNMAAGYVLNPLGLIPGFGVLTVNLDFKGLLPLAMPVDYGTTTKLDTEMRGMTWLGGQHVYLNGPGERSNSISFKQSASTFEKWIETETWEPAKLIGYDKVKWRWGVERKDVTLSVQGGVIVGNSDGFDKEGFVQTASPQFSSPPMNDALLYPEYKLFCTYTGDDIAHLSIDDTKIIDGTFTNVVGTHNCLLIASMYNVVRVRPGVSARDIRPYNVLQGLRLNKTIANWVQGIELMHAFDGYGGRIQSWQGITGGDIEELNVLSAYLPSRDPIVLHSTMPPSAYFGKFSSVPRVLYRHPINLSTKDNASVLKGTNTDTSVFRVSIPVLFRRAADYPTGIQTIDTYKLFVIDGVTSLTTDFRNAYLKATNTVKDVMMYGGVYRSFVEYLSKADQQYGALSLRDTAVKLGQKVIGSDTKSILFWSRLNRQFYRFIGSETLGKESNAYRLKDIDWAVYEFLRQELIADADMQLQYQPEALLRFSEGKAVGMVPLQPSDMEVIDRIGSLAGYVIQGRERSQVAFMTYDDNMHTLGLKENRGHWKRVPGDTIRDFFVPREYPAIEFDKPTGYYWEPFRLATAFLGVDDSTDAQFEWVITFAFTEWMYSIVGDKYVTVNIACETSCPNGHKKSEVTHVRLRNDMFQRSEERIGYYTFRFNGRNGVGNSERLFIWCDGVMALRKLELVVRPVTTQRTSPLLTQADFVALDEL